MITVHFTIKSGNEAKLNEGNVDDRIPGARHESRGLCVFKITSPQGAKLPQLMVDHAVIKNVTLTEKGLSKPYPIGRIRQGDAEVSVNLSAGKCDVSITGKSFADVMSAWNDLINGKLKPVMSKSISVENVSLMDGIKIVRLGIDAFKAARE